MLRCWRLWAGAGLACVPLACGGGSAPAAIAPVPPASPSSVAADPASAVAAKRLHGKVVCFGDSITLAEWRGVIRPEDRWVTQLGAKNGDITVVNEGKSGRTTQSGLAELDAVLDANGDAAVVVVFLGVNDLKHATAGVVERATANLARMVDRIRDRIPGARILLATPIAINEATLSPGFRRAGFGAETMRFLKEFSIAYRSLAGQKHIDFVDLLDVVAAEDIPDGVHPNGRGQRRIAEAVYRALAGE